MTMTKEQAMEIINTNGKNTNWFNNSICEAEMIDMFRNEFMFGASETAVIMAALKLAGADFKRNGSVFRYTVLWKDYSCWGVVGANNLNEAKRLVTKAYASDVPDHVDVFSDEDDRGQVMEHGKVEEVGFGG